jgi:hypothetical protein
MEVATSEELRLWWNRYLVTVLFFFTFFDVVNTLIYHVLFAVELKPQLIPSFLLPIIVYRLRLWKTSKPKNKSQVQSIQTDLQYVIFNHGQLLKS